MCQHVSENSRTYPCNRTFEDWEGQLDRPWLIKGPSIMSILGSSMQWLPGGTYVSRRSRVEAVQADTRIRPDPASHRGRKCPMAVVQGRMLAQ